MPQRKEGAGAEVQHGCENLAGSRNEREQGKSLSSPTMHRVLALL